MKKESKSKQSEENDSVFDRGAEWFVKKERGLTASEAEEFESAIRAEPELANQMEGFRETKAKVRALPAEFVEEMLSPDSVQSSSVSIRFVFGALAAVMALGFSFYFFKFKGESVQEDFVRQTVQSPTATKTHLLPDGSLIRLNINTHLDILYSETQRRIRLVNGEALFEVMPDADRKFVVDVDGIEVRAIGTAFNVRRSEDIDVIVTDGIVEVVSPYTRDVDLLETTLEPSSIRSISEKLVAVGQRARVVRGTASESPNIEVFDMEAEEVEYQLDWRKSLLALNGENLVEMASSFEQKTGYRLIIANPSLENLRIGGRFPSNDVYGFLRILKTGYGIPWKETEDGLIVLGNDGESESSH